MASAMGRVLALGKFSGARYLMAGAVLGAVVALSLNMTLSPPEPVKPTVSSAGSGPMGGGMPAASSAPKSPYDVPAGTCLNWTEPDGSDMTSVDCDEPHVFEVTGLLNVEDEFPGDAQRPSIEDWRKIATSRCEDGVEEYLGGPLDPAGKFSITALLPNNQEWESGDRTLRCGLWRIGPGGGLQATTGSAKDQNQADVWVAGTCLGLADKAASDPVPCEEVHSYEIIAVIDLSKHFGDGYPSLTKQNKRLDRVCANRIAAYSGGMELSSRSLIASWDTRSQESWQAGSTLVNCKVAKLRSDKSGLGPVTGSIAKTPPPQESGSSGEPGGDSGGDDAPGNSGGNGSSSENAPDSPGNS